MARPRRPAALGEVHLNAQDTEGGLASFGLESERAETSISVVSPNHTVEGLF